MTATALPVATDATGAAITEAQLKTWLTNVRAAIAEQGDPTARYGAIQNLSLACSVGSSALTIALKTRAAANADADNPISIPFRNVTSATGDFSAANITAANSLVISSGSTMGATSAKAFRLWVVMFNDGGTYRLGAINCLTTVAGAGAGRDVTAIYPLKDDLLASATAEGGAGAADSSGVIYAGATVTAKAMRILAYLEWSSGLTTAGTWDAVPTKIQLFGAGVPLPGQVVQVARNQTGAMTTGTTAIPHDDSIPQSGEGDQYMSQAITPSSAANVLSVEHVGIYSVATAVDFLSAALFQDATANALAAVVARTAAAAAEVIAMLRHMIVAGTASVTTMKIRAGSNTGGGTVTFNGVSSGRIFGGVMASSLQVTEIMA